MKLQSVIAGILTFLSICSYSSTMIGVSSIEGDYHCKGNDTEAGNYVIHHLIIAQDKQTSILNKTYASYKITINDIDTKEGGAYSGILLVDLKRKIGANFVGDNPKKAKDYGTGLVNFDKFNKNKQLQQFTIVYYEPEYSVNGEYTCWINH